jgi:hypothetical protein
MNDNVADPGSAEAITCADFERAYLLDRRAFHRPLTRDAQRRPIPYEPPRRSLVTGICLHQTACDMGLNPERYDTISVHYVVLRNGRATWHADHDRILYGGNGWNQRCIQIEVNGLYAGLEDDPETAVDESLKTTWDDPTTKIREQPQQVTPEAMATLRMLVRYIKLKTPTITKLVAHRQSSGSRRNDPGERIWREAVALHGELGLDDGGIGYAIPDGAGGKPIPEQWDARSKGIRY